MPVRAAMLSRTNNITGHPAIALPAGRNRRTAPKPAARGPRGRTARLLDVAAALEGVIH